MTGRQKLTDRILCDLRVPFSLELGTLWNAIERAALLSEGTPIEPEHLRLDDATERDVLEGDGDLRAALARFERQRIAEVLERTSGNQTEAARLLGIPRRTLVHKLREHGLGRHKP